MSLAATTPLAALARFLPAVRSAVPHLATFGGVGIVAFLVDVGVFNALRATVLMDQVIWAKVVSVTIATGVAWLGHRQLTFRATRRSKVAAELLFFVLANGGGLLIAAGCLFVSHYLLGFTSALADNVAGNVVGLALGTAFRYLAYRFFVFAPTRETVS
ncbi:putative flippase GtrA (transmembrane translocase of bactoprenol-linked glucose) [Promicromonospora umidemergens]|uniref:GtrA/DPMS transmembrane domain-containing protein n=1 Tax=Promicromonospora umidemergens TaxID=629679 RepID=A0ABP8XMQ7_9MICO|nr:GtrA family protein [Promicromonospora umidemergens]MCP2285689.1 putative flippase GtrA (transmembrane translocase of bactoprenol-linked glucose) [Promicromonospora umidemergens]